MTRVADDELRARLLPLPRAWEPVALRRAAVLAPIVERDGEDWLLCIVRRADMREHGGQIAFPGGVEDGDPDPVACALREAGEEIGVAAAAVSLLGSLPSRRSSSGYQVHCVVGRLQPDAALQADPGEVARILPLPWRLLADPARWQVRRPPTPNAGPLLPPSPHFQLGDDLLWGLTGRFAFDLLGLPPPP